MGRARLKGQTVETQQSLCSELLIRVIELRAPLNLHSGSTTGTNSCPRAFARAAALATQGPECWEFSGHLFQEVENDTIKRSCRGAGLWTSVLPFGHGLSIMS